jgi:hypothetical protein
MTWILAVNWEAISAIGQLVGAFAVVISVLYLAVQVRSNARETRRAAMRSTLDALTRFAHQVAEHADLAELRNRGFRDFESLEDTDRARFNSYMHSLFRIVEDVYYQRSDGHLDPHRWRGLEAVMRDVNTAPGVQAWWRSHSHWFDGEEFVKFINQQQQTAKPPKMFGEAKPDQ